MEHVTNDKSKELYNLVNGTTIKCDDSALEDYTNSTERNKTLNE